MQRRWLPLALVALACCRLPLPSADLVVRAKRVHGASGADSIAIRGGVVTAVGAFEELESQIGDATDVVEIEGGLILPGFEDSHIHLLSGGLSLFEVDLFEAETLEEIQRRVASFAADNPDEPWVRGLGWRYTALPDGRLPTAADLDTVVSDRPAFLVAYDGHSAWANTLALERAGIDESTELEGYGEIVRDARGRPTGTLKESAMSLVGRQLAPPDRDEKLEALRRATGRLASVGTVAFQNASGDEEELGLYEELFRNGELNVRVAMAMSVSQETTDSEIERIAELAREHTGPWLKVVGVKIVLDGVIESHTAAMLEPYADADTRGEPAYAQAELDDLVGRCHRAGLQIWIHAIGDRAVRMALGAFQRADEAGGGPSDPRFRIEHIETIHPDDLPRFAELGVLAAMQPIHAYPSTVAVWSKAVGEARLPYAFAWRSLEGAGARLVFGTDWPASISVAPLRGIHNAVNRRTLEGDPPGGFVPEQRVSLERAVAAFTTDAAYAAFEEDRRGALRPGQLGDLVVLSKDIFELPPMEIAEAEPLLTVVGGRVSYRRNE